MVAALFSLESGGEVQWGIGVGFAWIAMGTVFVGFHTLMYCDWKIVGLVKYGILLILRPVSLSNWKDYSEGVYDAKG